MLSKRVKFQLEQIQKAFDIYKQVKQTPSFSHGFQKEKMKLFPDIYHFSVKKKNQPKYVFFDDDENLLLMVHGVFDEVVHLYENNELSVEEVEAINIYYEKWYDGEKFYITK